MTMTRGFFVPEQPGYGQTAALDRDRRDGHGAARSKVGAREQQETAKRDRAGRCQAEAENRRHHYVDAQSPSAHRDRAETGGC